MKRLNEADYSTSAPDDADTPRGTKADVRRMFKFSEPSKYDPETGKVTSGRVVKTPLLALADDLRKTLITFKEAAEENPDDEQLDFLFKSFKRTSKSFVAHIKKNYKDVSKYI